ncbi:MAG: GNAT family N-acetyltransferase [candidate division Zixibacteria bacterium]|nr:GNAT family N-acetyltransferase [candidate division Zixibacteria bacterium]
MRRLHADPYDLHVSVIRSFDDLKSHAVDWNTLACNSPHRLPMLSHAWVSSYLEHRLKPEESWFCLLAMAKGRLVGVLPLVESRRRRFGTRCVWLRTPNDLHTISVDFLVHDGLESVLIPRLIAAIDQHCPDWCGLELRRLPEQSPTLRINDHDVSSGLILREFDGYGSYVDTHGSFEEYQSQLSANFRRNLKRAAKHLGDLRQLSMIVVSGPDSTDADLERFMRLEASGWKGRAGSAIMRSPDLQRFYHTLTRRLTEAGMLEWHFLKTGDTTLAGHLACRVNGALVFCKIAYDEDYSYYSPGNYLFEQLVKRACQTNALSEINCLTDMDWHRNWKTQLRAHYNVYFYPKRLRAILTGAFPRRIWIAMKKSPLLRQIKNRLFDK